MDHFNLMLGDCIERMRDIPDGSVDLVLTDPPYGTTACKWDAVIPFEEMWAELKRVLKRNGAAVFTASQPFTSTLVVSNLRCYKHAWRWVKQRPSNPQLAKKAPLKYDEGELKMAVTRNMMLSAANRMVERFFELGDQGREVALRMNIEGDDQGRASGVTLSFESGTKADETTKEHVGPQERIILLYADGAHYHQYRALYADGAHYHQDRALYPEHVVVLRPTLTNLTGRTADMIMVSDCINLDADCQRQGSYRSLMTKRLKDPSQPLLVLFQST